MAEADTIDTTDVGPARGPETATTALTTPKDLEPPKSVTTVPPYEPIAPKIGQELFTEFGEERQRHARTADILERSMQREADLRRQEREESRPGRQEVVRDIDQQLEFRRQHPPQEPQALPPRPKLTYDMRQIIGPPGSDKPGNQFMQMATVFASLSGGTVQQRMTMVLEAFHGMVTGWAQGNKDRFEESYSEWKDQIATIKENETRRNKYIDDVLSNSRESMQLKMDKLKLLGTETHDAMLAESAFRGDIQAIDKQRDAITSVGEKMFSVAEKIDKDREKQTIEGSITPDMVQRFQAKLAGRPDWRAGLSQREAKAYFLAEPIIAQQQGIDPAQVNTLANQAQARQRGELSFSGTAGRLAANAIQANEELQGLIPQVIAAARQLDLSDWQIVNKAIQAGQAQHSNPKYNAYMQALYDALNAYGRAMNPRGQPRFGEKKEAEARGVLSETVGLDAIETQLYNMWYASGVVIDSAKHTLQEGLNADPFARGFPSPAAGTEEQLTTPPRLRTAPTGPPASIGTYEDWVRQNQGR